VDKVLLATSAALPPFCFCWVGLTRGWSLCTQKHPEFELTYDMMLGIRTSVSQVESKAKRNLKDSYVIPSGTSARVN
jgi:hypothetical protein